MKGIQVARRRVRQKGISVRQGVRQSVDNARESGRRGADAAIAWVQDGERGHAGSPGPGAVRSGF